MTKRSGGTPWKIILAALVVVFIGAQIVTLIIAARKVSPVVDPDYYRKGLHYGETVRQEQVNRP
ncbi:FixH family protein [Trichlorobacter ammonificans]|uniref:Uncharacterized protein n=1 Tax=Trichlorobacter ammonificans TaxID=2916410 RepID=A0ABN8HL18_9BACT|nr:FixH family protein [Trichlorobacter ammonificans]CAH2031749.1 protein of unknown function [Trichlorobacter ammonificans]